jgi:hypothetical protein
VDVWYQLGVGVWCLDELGELDEVDVDELCPLGVGVWCQLDALHKLDVGVLHQLDQLDEVDVDAWYQLGVDVELDTLDLYAYDGVGSPGL